MGKLKRGQRMTPQAGDIRPPSASPMTRKIVLACHGSIRFEFTADGKFAIRQGWNPGNLSRENRTAIAKELREIADQMDQDHFEDGQKYRHYPIRVA